MIYALLSYYKLVEVPKITDNRRPRACSTRLELLTTPGESSRHALLHLFALGRSEGHKESATC